VVDRSRGVPCPVALLLLVLTTACSAGKADEREHSVAVGTADAASTATGVGTGRVAAADCRGTDWPGPWTVCPQADWVRRVAAAAGYRTVGETGSALIAKGRGDNFYIWATQPERTAEEVAGETWQEIGTVGRHHYLRRRAALALVVGGRRGRVAAGRSARDVDRAGRRRTHGARPREPSAKTTGLAPHAAMLRADETITRVSGSTTSPSARVPACHSGASSRVAPATPVLVVAADREPAFSPRPTAAKSPRR